MIRRLIYILLTVVCAVLVYIILRLTIPTAEVQQVSMMPTLQPGERLVMNKLAYIAADPQRGDIITFYPLQQSKPDLLEEIFPWSNTTVPLIKRTIGLPGDTIEIKNGKIIVNGSVLNEPYIKDPPRYTLRPMKIPDGEYFVLGDNRNNSNDSHLGWTIPIDRIVGKAWLIYWPPQRIGTAPNYQQYAVQFR
ncbi:MAG TPA: signal peptidase I [Dehalococcoidia bacterium]|nr:signal peptidase I [Dehalococcoidia bacterium]